MSPAFGTILTLEIHCRRPKERHTSVIPNAVFYSLHFVVLLYHPVHSCR
jgi:hypothetical protein